MSTQTDVLPHARLLLHVQCADLGDCWAEGYEAFAHDSEETANPYKAGSKEHEYWAEGWWASYYGEEPLFELQDEALELAHLEEQPLPERSAKKAVNSSPSWLRSLQIAVGVAFAALGIELLEFMAIDFAVFEMAALI